MITSLVTAPSEYPVSIDQCKSDLRIQHEMDYDLIDDFIAAATDYAQEYLGKKIISQTWDFSTSYADSCDRIYLPYANAQSITSIKYYDADNVEQTLTVADYYFYKLDDKAFLMPKPDKNWPVVYSRIDAITIRFVVGYGGATEVPAAIVRAIRLLVAHWYEHREAVTLNATPSALIMGVESLLNIHRIGWAG